MGSSEEEKAAGLPAKSGDDRELYEEILNRYERMLVFAGTLQERLKGQKLLAEKNEDLSRENERLHRTVAAGDAYIRVLEESLRAIGLLRPHPGKSAEAESDVEE